MAVSIEVVRGGGGGLNNGIWDSPILIYDYIEYLRIKTNLW